MSFSEVRDYTSGDDVRNIDWNVTARFSHPYVKVFEEERELTVMLLIDCSTSTLFGTSENNKRDVITELAAIIAFSAINNNDKVGAIFFSDSIEKYIPPQKGKSHILHIIRELLTITPKANTKTSIDVALTYFTNMYKKRSVAFLLSDFNSTSYDTSLQLAKRKHDIIGIHLFDKTEQQFPNIGLVQLQDLETKETKWIDTSIAQNRTILQKIFTTHQQEIKKSFAKAGTDLLNINIQEDYIKSLQVFFKNR